MEGVGQSGLATDLSEISARVESSPFLREFSGSFPDLTASASRTSARASRLWRLF